MKKALALVLALVLALSMGVSAFALELVTLKPAATTTAGLKTITDLPNVEGADNESYVIAGEGGVYYVKLANAKYEDVEVTASGNVTAKVVEYDPTVFEYDEEIPYYIYDRVNGKKLTDLTEYASVLSAAWKYHDEAKTKFASGYAIDGEGYLIYMAWDKDGNVTKTERVAGIYAHRLAIATILNVAAKTTQYVVKTDANTDLIELTVADNYTAAYTEGLVKISATLDEKAVSAKVYVIRDVTIWDYETVRSAGDYEFALNVSTDKGYSDYLTYLYGYKDAELKGALVDAEPTVISTTAFRYCVGNEITVVNDGLTVEIEEVQADQKGVNFERLDGGYAKVDKGGVVEVYDAAYWAKGLEVFDHLEFGFHGAQTVKGDFTVSLTLPYNYFQLRELFGVKVEEDDIITYYLLKDGKVIEEIEVDYMTIDPYEKPELEINASNTTLGQYEIRLDVQTTADAETEENPNTGAESVVGVVAALAVVSVATAAAVSLKK